MAEHFAGNAIPGERGNFQPPNLTQDQQARLDRFNRLVVQANSMGFRPWSVVNLAPFTVNPPNIKLFGLQIPAVPIVEELWDAAPKIELRSGIKVPFTHWVCTTPQFDVCQQVHGMTDDDFTAVTEQQIWFPENITADIVVCNNQQERRGGVWRYAGPHAPLTDKTSAELELSLFEEAYTDLLKFCEKKFMEAQEAMGSTNEKIRSRVRPLHRWCVWYLVRTNALKETPEWLKEIKTVNQSAPVYCGNCGERQKNDQTAICKDCNYINKPYEALVRGLIDMETPGAMTALRRCTKKQLDELGLYPRIKPLGEYLRDLEKTKKEKD